MPINKNQLLRLQTILKMLRKGMYPNSTSFIKEMQKMDVVGDFQISCKTFSRDIAFLRDGYKAPIHYDATRKGFFLTDPDWFNRDLMVEPAEMKAALLGERIASSILPGPMQAEINEAISALLMKNESGMAEGVELENLQVLSWNNLPKVDPEIFMAVYSAWEEHKYLKIVYRSSQDKISEKYLEPYILAWKNGVWYLKGRIHRNDTTRYDDEIKIQVLALHRIGKVLAAEGNFYPDAAVLNKLKKSSLFVFEKLPEVDVTFFYPAARTIAERFYDSIIEKTEQGIRFVIKDITEYEALELIFSSFGNAKVHAPESLRNTLRETALQALKNLEQ